LAEKRFKEWHVAKRNPRTGSRFDDFLKEEGIFAEVQAKALKRALAEQLEESMHAAKLTKLDMAKKMATSRSQLDRVLDPSNVFLRRRDSSVRNESTTRRDG
jgi:antitoxin HicB